MSFWAGKKILVVDDEEMICDILSYTFGNLGAKVVTASSGQDALLRIKEEDFDIVLTDVRMQNGDGVFLVEKITSKDFKKPKIFFFSGYGDVKDIDLQKLGVIKMLTKPFDLHDLIREIEVGFRKSS